METLNKWSRPEYMVPSFERYRGPMSLQEMERILKRITYKENFTLRLQGDTYVPRLDIEMRVPNAQSKQHEFTRVLATHPIPQFVENEDAFIHWIRDRLHWMECHEADEWLEVDGKKIFNPHK